MTYCVVPGCLNPQNPDEAKVCQSCGSELLLRSRYRPIQAIAQGGMGRTFLAVDEDLPSKPRCVIKQLYLQQGSTNHLPKVVQLFHQEASRLDSLGQHPQIPSLFAHFEQANFQPANFPAKFEQAKFEQANLKQNCWLYLVQEWIEGQTLAAELQAYGSFSEAKIVQLLRDLLPVLKFVHQNQVIHRDIKPANIIRRQSREDFLKESNLVETASRGELVLIDFGIAKLFTGNALLQTGTIIGTPAYMAPEQSRGKALPASDLYSLGVTCIHLLTGVSPNNLYDANNDCWAWRDRLPGNKTVSQTLANILDKLLQSPVSQRYKSAAEVLKALQTPSRSGAIAISGATVSRKSGAAKSGAAKSGAAKSGARKSGAARSLVPRKQRPVTKAINGKALSFFWSKLLPWQKQPKTNDLLDSEVGLDYSKLRDLLAARKWKEADEETRSMLCRALGKYPRAYIYTDEIGKLPCADLQTIDRLWVKYSEARFGFSVQALIYESSGEDYGSFCDRIGWLTYNPNSRESWLKFKRSAPVGHLPSRSWAGGMKWWLHAGAMAARLRECNIS